MYKGEPSQGLEFFELLCNNDEFCAELGRAMLAAGRLEAELINHLNSKGIEERTKDKSLGRLIGFAKKHDLLSKMVPSLEMLIKQRNYLAHNIYALFSGLVEETILPRSELLDSDVWSFTDKATVLKENLNGLTDIIIRENAAST